MHTKVLNYLIYSYIILLPLIPSKLKIKFIPANGDVLLGIIIILYAFMIVISNDSRKKFIEGLKDFMHNFFSIFVLILLLMMFLSIAYSQYKLKALMESIRFLTYIALYFIIKYETNDRDTINNMIKCFVFTVTLLGIIGIVQMLTKIGVSQFTYYGDFGTRIRIPSTLENPNSFGGLLILSVFPIIMMAISEKKIKLKVMYSFASLILFINILLTQSRNAWLGFALGAVILALIYNIKLLLIFFGIGGCSLLLPQISSRLREFSDFSQNISRINLWKVALIIIKENPFLGIGNGNYQKVYGEYIKRYPELEYNHHTEFEVHNNYLKIQSELGVIGSIGFLGMIFSVILRIRNLIVKNIDKKYKAFFKGFLASFIAFAFMNLSDDFFLVPKIVAYFWILFAVSESIQYRINDYTLN